MDVGKCEPLQVSNERMQGSQLLRARQRNELRMREHRFGQWRRKCRSTPSDVRRGKRYMCGTLCPCSCLINAYAGRFPLLRIAAYSPPRNKYVLQVNVSISIIGTSTLAHIICRKVARCIAALPEPPGGVLRAEQLYRLACLERQLSVCGGVEVPQHSRTANRRWRGYARRGNGWSIGAGTTQRGTIRKTTRNMSS